MPVRALPKELQEKAKNELFEDPNRLESDLQSLKDWIAKQPHLKARTDDQWLVTFLRGCKFSLEKTKEKLDLYYSVRTNAPEFFKIKPWEPRFIEILELGSFLVMPPKFDESLGYIPRVAIIRPGAYDADKYHISEVLSVSNTIQKILFMEDDTAVIAGSRSILDLEGVTFSHFMQMTPFLMKKMVVISQDALPVRMKGAHYLNTPPGFETVFNAIKGLLNQKNQNRLYVHNKDYDALYKHIPKHILPVEYGGENGTIKEVIEYWKNKLQEYRSFLEEDEKYGTDEAKRPGKPKTAEDMFGVEGSFRKLEFD